MRWSGGRLFVNSSFSEDPKLLDLLYNSCLDVFRFTSFTTSRWLTIGSSARSLVAACSLGLRGLFAAVMEDPLVGEYYISGFSRLSEATFRYCVISALGTRPSEAVSIALLEDDRAVAQIDKYEGSMREEVLYLTGLPMAVYELLASHIDAGSSATELRSQILDSELACSYTYQHFLSEVRSLPFSLGIGDIQANLAALAAQDQPPADDTACKIWKLMRLHSNLIELTEAVALFKQISWSTRVAEQIHGFAAVLHKLHREYGEETIAARAGCAYLRALVAEDPSEVAANRTKRRLTLLGKKQPEKTGGRQLFVGEFVHQAKERSAASETLQSKDVAGFFAAGSQQWTSLPPAVKRAYSSKADAERVVKRVRLEADKSLICSDLALATSRRAEDLQNSGVVSRLSAARFSGAQRVRFNEIWQSMSDVHHLRKVAMAPIDKPAADWVDAIASIVLPTAPSVTDVEAPPWCKRVAAHRALLVGSGIAVVGPETTRYYAFMYASQNPVEVCLMPMVPQTELVHVAGALGPYSFQTFAITHQQRFVLTFGAYVSGRRLQVSHTEYVHVIPALLYLDDLKVAALSAEIYLEDYLKGQVEEKDTQTQRKKGVREQALPEQRQKLEAHPWLERVLEKAASSKAGQQGKPGQGKQKEAKPNTVQKESTAAAEAMPEDQQEDIMNVLAAKRQEMLDKYGDGDREDFEVKVLGGVWTLRNKGVACDCVRARASRGDVTDICKLIRLSQSFSVPLDKIGEVLAHALAAEWCCRMQHIYDHLCAHTGPRFMWTDAFFESFPSDPTFEERMRQTCIPEAHAKAAQIVAIAPTRNGNEGAPAHG